MAENGKTSGTFAGGLNWEPEKEANDVFEALPATHAEVANYVNNAFKQWHQPTHVMTVRNTKVVETLLLFLQEAGLTVPEQKVAITQEDIEAGFVTVPATRVLLLPGTIQKWNDEKVAAQVAAETPKEQQS